MTRASTLNAPKVAPDGYLDALPWTFTTGGFDALGHRFAVRTTDASFGRYVQRAFASLAAAGPTATTYSLLDRAPGARPFALYADDEQLIVTSQPSLALATLAWHVNRQVVARNGGLTLLHAAGAERDGVGMVLAGAMESGKTTLVAGLVRRGWSYLTDEVVAIDPGSGLIRPYPKPLSIDPGSFEVLADLRPSTEPGVEPYLTRQWQVDASSIRPGAVAGPTLPRIVVLTRYVGGADTQLRPLGRREMLLELIEQTFDFHAAGAHNLTTLGRALADTRCFRLQVGDLETACRLLERVISDDAAGGPR